MLNLIQLLTIILGVKIASAIPLAEPTTTIWDANVTHIALDERNGQYVGYGSDGILHGRYGIGEISSAGYQHSRRADIATSCSQLSSDDLQKLTGWPKVHKKAIDLWGKDKHGKDPVITTNPHDFLDKSAHICVDPTPIVPSANGPPMCIKRTGTFDGKSSGANSTMKIEFQQGFSTTSTWTVVRTSLMAYGAKFTTRMDFDPLLFSVTKIKTKIEGTATFTNTQSNSFETECKTDTTQNFQVNNKPNSKCDGKLYTTSCTRGGKARIKLIADGWAWFSYQSPVKGHYKWALNLQSVLPNVNDRSSEIEIFGSMQGELNGDFDDDCK